jgi:hypothetical protein
MSVGLGPILLGSSDKKRMYKSGIWLLERRWV